MEAAATAAGAERLQLHRLRAGQQSLRAELERRCAHDEQYGGLAGAAAGIQLVRIAAVVSSISMYCGCLLIT